MVARRVVVYGVAAGFAVAAGFVGMDLFFPHRTVVPTRDEARPGASGDPTDAPTVDPPAPSASVSASAASPHGSSRERQPEPGRSASAPHPTAPATGASAAPVDAAAGMVRIPGGTYKPTFLTHTVEVKSFLLDVTEVTRGAFLACVDASGCAANAWAKPNAPPNPKAPPNEMPAADVTWSESKAFCAWAKKRLPAEVEWELAARGLTDARVYPWGAVAPAEQPCWRRTDGPCLVGSHAAGDTPLGVKDLAGNVWEWTAEDHFCTNPDQPDSCDPYRHVARGGGWNAFTPKVLENTFRNAMNEQASYVGFRCAKDAP